MNVEAFSPAAVFRRRSAWEAVDLGILLWQNNWIPLLVFTGIPAGILGFLAKLPLKSTEMMWLGTVLFWWIKPFIDRFCLHVVSVRFFNPNAPFRKLFHGLFRTLRTGLAADLLWRRFSSGRSARMPLVVLERLRGKNYRRRKTLLGRNGLGFGLSLTVICLGMSLVLEAGVMVFMYGLMDIFQEGAAGTLMEFLEGKTAAISIFTGICFILTETLYVCMGFGLYINSRVETEGWDIELYFKKCLKETL